MVWTRPGPKGAYVSEQYDANIGKRTTVLDLQSRLSKNLDMEHKMDVPRVFHGNFDIVFGPFLTHFSRISRLQLVLLSYHFSRISQRYATRFFFLSLFPRRMPCSTCRPCTSDADWCLHSNGVPDSRHVRSFTAAPS